MTGGLPTGLAKLSHNLSSLCPSQGSDLNHHLSFLISLPIFPHRNLSWEISCMSTCSVVHISHRTEFNTVWERLCAWWECKCANTIWEMQCWRHCAFVLVCILKNVICGIQYFTHSYCMILNYMVTSLYLRQNMHSSVQLNEIFKMKNSMIPST